MLEVVFECGVFGVPSLTRINSLQDIGKFEVVGNVYENHELLEWLPVLYNDRALCRCGISIPSARNHCPDFDKVKCLEPMFGDVGHARTKAAMLLLMIDTT